MRSIGMSENYKYKNKTGTLFEAGVEQSTPRGVL
jgi:hypothetical protein